MRSVRFKGVLAGLLLVVLVSAYAPVGSLAPYVVAALGLIALPYVVTVRNGRRLIFDLAVAGFTLAFVLIIVAYALTAKKPTEVVAALGFAWLPLFGTMRTLLWRQASASAGKVMARLAMAGTLLTVAVAAAMHADPTAIPAAIGWSPVQLGDIALILGLMSLAGVLTETPAVAALSVAVTVIGIGAAYETGALDVIASAIRELAGLEPAGPRGEIWRAAVAAFRAKPWFGVGPLREVAAAAAHLPKAQKALLAGATDLQADIPNFMLGAGALGVVAYAAILLTPVAAAFATLRDSLYPVRIYGTLVLAIGFLLLGLGASQLGTPGATALYCGLAAVLLGFCRETSLAEIDAANSLVPLRAEPGVVTQAAVWVLLVLTLVASTTVGLLTPYIVVAVAAAIWIWLLFAGRLSDSYAPRVPRAELSAFLLIGLLYLASSQQASDVLYVFNFTMLLVFGPILFLLRRVAGKVTVEQLGWMAIAGIGISLLVVLHDVRSGNPRPSEINLGPIVLSNALLALAVIATMAAMASRSRPSLLLLLALPLAAATSIITQSRGPLISIVPLLLVSIVFLWLTRFRRSRMFWWVTGGGVVVFAAGAAFLIRSRTASVVSVITETFGGGKVTDLTTNIRIALYHAGWQSFLQSPLIGHGWARLMTSIYPLVDPKYLAYAKKLPQLHNDLINFAVSGGVIGVGIYLLILFAPLVAAVLGTRDALKPVRIYATLSLAIVYAGGGLTDLMFGQEFHTMLFVMLNAIVLGLVRQPAPERAPLA